MLLFTRIVLLDLLVLLLRVPTFRLCRDNHVEQLCGLSMEKKALEIKSLKHMCAASLGL